MVLSLHCGMTDLGGCETVRIRVRIGLADCTQSDQKVGWTSAGIGRSQPRNQRHGCSRHGFDTGSGASNRSMTQSRPNHGPSGPWAVRSSRVRQPRHLGGMSDDANLCRKRGHGPPPTDTRLLMRRKGSSGVTAVQGGLGVLGTMGTVWGYAIHGLGSGA